MRLLHLDHSENLCFTRDLSENEIPPYGILSHTWGADEEELTYNDVQEGVGKNKKGYAKVLFTGKQSKKDGLQHFWVDSCCINKANFTELSEAINSMFRWYKNAEKCYVYLTDVSTHKRDCTGDSKKAWEGALRTSRWFTRGWTLQELLAPKTVEFFSREEECLGNKDSGSLQQMIAEVTGIPVAALQGRPLSEFSEQQRFQWAAKRNTKKIEDKAYCLLGIFGVNMPFVYGEGSEAEDRLKDQIAKSYRKQLDAPYQGSGAASAAVDIKSHCEALLESLEFAQMDSRRVNIKKEFSSTCKWLLQHPSYQDWYNMDEQHRHRGFFWIKGKPGAGKSTLMMFVHAQAVKQRKDDEIVVSFFFNARGDELERSTIGMYRSILLQILRAAPDLQDVLEGVSQNGRLEGGTHSWTTESLRDIISKAIARLGERRLRCFIDALDECDEEEVRDMVEFWEEISETSFENTGSIAICFASRHYPTIEITHGTQLILEAEKGHSDDLAKFVQARLRAGKGKMIGEIRARILEKANGVFMWTVLVVDILNREFLSGRLFAVKKRLEEIPPGLSDLFKDMLRRNHDNMEDMLLCLQWILFAKRPLSPREFYFAVVSGLTPDSDSIGPGISSQIDDESVTRFVLNSSKGLAETTRVKVPTVQFIHESVGDFLMKDRGLYELWPNLAKDLYGTCHDQLKNCCHNYLLCSRFANADRSLVLQDEVYKPASQEAQQQREELKGESPFLEYATREILYHAEEAAASVAQDDFLHKFPLRLWITTTNALERYAVRQHTPDASFVYILARYNWARLLGLAIRLGYFTTPLDAQSSSPLVAAVEAGNLEACQVLLGISAFEGSLQEHLTQMPPCSQECLVGSNSVGDKRLCKALMVAVKRGHDKIVEALLDSNLIKLSARDNVSALIWAIEKDSPIVGKCIKSRAIDLDAKNEAGNTALMTAIRHGRLNIVTMLLDAGVDVNHEFNTQALGLAVERKRAELVDRLLNAGTNVRGEAGADALYSAVAGGSLELVAILLDAGVDVNYESNTRALGLAVRRKNIELVDRLLNAGANVRDAAGTGLLHSAVASGSLELVAMLLDAGASTEPANGLSPFTLAVRNDNPELVAVLLNASTNRRTECKWLPGALVSQTARKESCPDIVAMLLDAGITGETLEAAILVAVEKRRYDSMQKILDAGIEIAVHTNYAKSVFLDAVTLDLNFGCVSQIINKLLDLGLDIEIRDYFGRTALARAAETGSFAAVTLLLHRGARLESKDISGNTPLINTSAAGHDQIASLLLDLRADIHASSLFGYTAVMLAAMNGHDAVVLLLLKRGGNVHGRNADGETALVLAATDGHDPVVSTLLAHGADIDSASSLGRTALMSAAAQGHVAVMETLLKNDARTDCVDIFYDTALRLAVQNKQWSAEKKLVEWGADSHTAHPRIDFASELISHLQTTGESLGTSESDSLIA